ncbi:unnamed protein product [Boreogadus saida]
MDAQYKRGLQYKEEGVQTKREMLKTSKEIKEKAKKKRKRKHLPYLWARNIHDLGIDMEHLITWGMFEIDRKSFIGHQAGNTVLV